MGIRIYNLAAREFDTENVCAEGAMRFLYETKVGKLATWALVKRAFFSRLCGVWADSKISARKIEAFVDANAICREEMVKDTKRFQTFNEFFTRALVPQSRPVADCAVSFPSDGRHLLVRNATSNRTFYVKGTEFNLESFLGDSSLAGRFDGCDMLISRLSPVDYHRFHYPISGEVSARKLIRGALYSVSPIALVQRLSIFWENRRVVNLIDSRELGLCAFVEIGATNVGSIVNFDKVGAAAKRGDEAGYFKLGGSCVATLVPRGAKIKWNPDLERMGAEGVECYAKVGGAAAEFIEE